MSQQPVTANVAPATIYTSVRQEILDQKKCQFQLFSAALTLTAAVLAYASSIRVNPLIYVTPMLMNVLALTIILDKAVSIQRMVGYLQLMESDTTSRWWMWEYHLNLFREISGRSCGSESHRKHTYIRNIALMLLTLNLVASSLYGFGPEAIALRHSTEYGPLREVYGAAHLVVLLLNAFGVIVALRRWIQLVYGQFTSRAIRERWLKVLSESPNQGIHPTAAKGAAAGDA